MGTLRMLNFLADYNKNAKKLKKRFDSKSRIKNMQKQHSLFPLENAKVRCRMFSDSLDFIDMQVID